MAGLNKAIVIGRLGADPKITRFDGGAINAFFSVATSENYTDKATGEKKEITEWHSIKAWSKLAEIIEKYVKKGSQVCIEGKMKTDKYTDKEGVERYTKYILASNMMMLDGKKDSEGNNSEKSNSLFGSFSSAPACNPNDFEIIEDEVPF